MNKNSIFFYLNNALLILYDNHEIMKSSSLLINNFNNKFIITSIDSFLRKKQQYVSLSYYVEPWKLKVNSV